LPIIPGIIIGLPFSTFLMQIRATESGDKTVDLINLLYELILSETLVLVAIPHGCATLTRTLVPFNSAYRLLENEYTNAFDAG